MLFVCFQVYQVTTFFTFAFRSKLIPSDDRSIKFGSIDFCCFMKKEVEFHYLLTCYRPFIMIELEHFFSKSFTRKWIINCIILVELRTQEIWINLYVPGIHFGRYLSQGRQIQQRKSSECNSIKISQLVCLNELYKKWRITLTREGKNLFTRYSGTLAP